jgi:hypothetical protein
MATTAWYEIKLKDNFTPGIKNAEKQVDNFEKKINNLNNNSNNLGSTFKGVFGGTIFANFAMKAGNAIKEVTQDIINLGFEMEKTRITMKTLLGGDANFSNNMIGDFQKFAKETPFSTKDVVEGARRLAAYQFQAEQMIPTMKKLGDVSAGLGLNLNDLIWVYGTTKVAGKVNARDIRQFQDRGIPITEYIAKATGKTQKEVLGGLKDIDFKDVSKAFDLMTQKGGPFFNLMEQLSKSVGGQWERLKDNVEIVMTDMGERLLPYLSEGINLLDSWVEAFDRMDFREWIEPIKQIYENIKGLNESLFEIFNLKGMGGAFLDGLRQLTKDVLLMTSSLTAVIDYVSKRAAAAGTSATWDRSMTDEEIDSFYKNNPGKDLTFENVLNSKLQQAADTWSGKYNYGGQNNFFGKSQGVLPATLYGPNSSNGLGYVSKGNGVNGSGSDGTDIGAEKIHSATRNITINIDTLVGEITFEQSIQDNTQAVVDAVKRVLLTAVNDVNLVSQ